MDSFTTIDDSLNSDISTLTSIISMLSIASAIGKNLHNFKNETMESKRQILFAFFNGVRILILNDLTF